MKNITCRVIAETHHLYCIQRDDSLLADSTPRNHLTCFWLQNPVTQSDSEEPSQIQYLSSGGKIDKKRKWTAVGWVVIPFCWGFFQARKLHAQETWEKKECILFPLSKSHGTEMSHFTQTVNTPIHNLTLEQRKKPKFAWLVSDFQRCKPLHSKLH